MDRLYFSLPNINFLHRNSALIKDGHRDRQNRWWDQKPFRCVHISNSIEVWPADTTKSLCKMNGWSHASFYWIHIQMTTGSRWYSGCANSTEEQRTWTVYRICYSHSLEAISSKKAWGLLPVLDVTRAFHKCEIYLGFEDCELWRTCMWWRASVVTERCQLMNTGRLLKQQYL